MTRSLPLAVLALALVLTPAALRAADKPEWKPVAVTASWSGLVDNDAPKRLAPASGMVVDAAAWAELWKAWRPKEDVPAVDFAAQLVLALTSSGPNRVGCTPQHDGQGNVRAIAMSTMMAGPGFGYLLLSIPRDGVKTVNGKAVPEAKKADELPPPPGLLPTAAPAPAQDVAPAPGTKPATAPAAGAAITPVDGLAVKPETFAASSAAKPLVLRSAKDAAEHFAEAELAKLTPQVDFASQVVLVFAWRGSGQDRLTYAVAESYPEQVTFGYARGRTRDLRPHVKVFVVRSNVKWDVK